VTQERPLLAVEDVSVELGGRPVLRGVSLEAEPGEVVGLLGPNAAGKTTLVRVASGVLSPRVGAVRILGRSVGSWPRRALARCTAVVPQDAAAPFPFTVGEVVLMGRTPHHGWLGLDGPEDVERALAALRRLGIAELAGRAYTELSGGERQLVLFARALVQEPRLLLLDEPTAFLDLRHRIEVLEAVRAFAADGGAALVVSHDLGLAARACDRLVLLAEGRVRARGTPAEVLAPEALREVYGIHADVLEAPDGGRLVVPRLRR